MQADDVKPAIEEVVSGRELKRWYWTKVELQAKAKQVGVGKAGAKFAILERIASKLDGYDLPEPVKSPKKSNFDWGKEDIHDGTVITDSYRNSQKVRAYMQSRIPGFNFNIDFMDWMKANTGKRMSDAVEYYMALSQRLKSGQYIPEIKRHNQYNQYLRDFFEANPNLSTDDAKLCWKYKTSLPSVDGMHAYDPSDLKALS